MKHLITMLAVAIVAFLGVATAVTAGSAQAAASRAVPAAGPSQAASAPASSSYRFYIHEPAGDINCIVIHGTYQQLTIGTSGCATISLTIIGTTPNGYYIYQFADSNKICLRANSANRVNLEGGPCRAGDTGEQWIITHSNPYRFENLGRSLWLKTDGDVSGYKVWVGTNGSNNWDLFSS